MACRVSALRSLVKSSQVGEATRPATTVLRRRRALRRLAFLRGRLRGARNFWWARHLVCTTIMSHSAPRVGDRVRVKQSVSEPACGWGDVDHNSIGTITSTDGNCCKVKFPEHSNWSGRLTEMECVPRTGDRVRVKPSVSEPHYKWGSVKRSSVGTITSIDGDDCRVKFPENSSWKGKVSEMERVDGSGGRLTTGDAVIICSGASNAGQRGTIIQDDGPSDDQPYKVRFGDGETKWYRAAQATEATATLIPASAPAPFTPPCSSTLHCLRR